jgi:xylan 1,4-beta-xylosidase
MNRNSKEYFYNPILAGFYPDPSICRVGEDYYLVNSTFSFYPGVPIFHSRDLVHWEQIGYVLDRPEQLNLDGLEVSQGVYAPTIRYNDGTFYMITTLVGRGGNFLVTAEDPKGPWSNPFWLPDVIGIDPSLFFDDDGKAYLIHNGEPPNDRSLYRGHRAIWLFEFDKDSKKTIGPKHLLLDGGTNFEQHPVWIEGPHIYKINGYYYLMAAEGGTSVNHSEVILRSKNVKGPYKSYEKNPILTQRHSDPNRKNPVTNTGHADFVETQNGEWWSVFLACRPYVENYFNTGRETFLAPVGWVDGWPRINLGGELVKYKYPVPNLKKVDNVKYPLNGNFTLKDDFNDSELADYWIFLRTVRERWYNLTRSKGSLSIRLRPEDIDGDGNPSFIGRRQQHNNCSAVTALKFTPAGENETAGLVAFQNGNYYYLERTISDVKNILQLKNNKSVLAQIELKDDEANKKLLLKIESKGKFYNFYYGTVANKWEKVKESVDAKFLSTDVAGGFVGVVFAMYASSQGKQSTNYADFDWFEYMGNDLIFI